MHTLNRKARLATITFLVGLLFVLLSGFGSAQIIRAQTYGDKKDSNYLLVWASDRGTDDGKQDPDFLAVIDANKRSPTYGKIVNTASIPCIPKDNVIAELGIIPEASSCLFNEAHHLNMEFYVDPKTNRKFLFTGGLISANIFRFDVTDPLHIPPATLVVDTRNVKKFSGTDDILLLPNGNLIATFMGAKNLTTPGGLVEFSPDGALIKEYNAAKPGGPKRYVPSIRNVTDTGLLAHPHGIALREDLNVLISSDFTDPLSLALSGFSQQKQDSGTTVRVWNLSNLAAGPVKIIQVPDGPRVEKNPNYEEPEGVMSAGLLHQKKNKGAFVSTMFGGVLYYTPDITAKEPIFKAVYDVGPNSGPGYFDISHDDKFLVLPISGMQSPGDPVYNRDYPNEHSRRVIVLDIQPLTAKGSNPILCSSPSVTNDPKTGFTTGTSGRNNGAPDCPKEVSIVNVDSDLNFSTHGGPHALDFDHENMNRFAFSNYFVTLDSFRLPGTPTGGDSKVYIANFNQETGAASIDTNFKYELTGEVGVNFNRPVTYKWPGERGNAGSAKPHGLMFIKIEDDYNDAKYQNQNPQSANLVTTQVTTQDSEHQISLESSKSDEWLRRWIELQRSAANP